MLDLAKVELTLTTQDGKQYGLAFRVEEGEDTPERILRMLKDLYESAAYRVSYGYSDE